MAIDRCREWLAAMGRVSRRNQISIDWRAVLLGGLVLGVLCSIPALGLTPPSPYVEGQADQPGPITVHYAYVIGAVGPFVAGFLARSPDTAGVLEGGFSIPAGAVVPVVVAAVDLFLSLGSGPVVRKLVLVVQFIGFNVMTALVAMPFACFLGGALGWMGRLTKDIATGSVRISWS